MKAYRATDEPHAHLWMRQAYEPGLVSVIVPTLNRVGIIEPTLASIHKQAYRPIEIVIVDDGSTDETQAWTGAWGAAHEELGMFRVIYMKHDTNRGPPAARNSGARACSGEFIQFLDSDDILCAGKLAAQVERLAASPALDYVYGRTNQVSLPDRVLGRVGAPMDPRWPARNIPGHHWHISGALFRRRLLVQTGPWNEMLRGSEDWEYAARVKAVSQRAVYLPDLVSLYVVHGSGQMIQQASRRSHESRRDAIRSVVSVLERLVASDVVARDMCARALIANAIEFRSMGEVGEMRRSLCEAARIGAPLTRVAARTLYVSSFLLPSVIFTRALRIARSLRHASALSSGG